MDGWIDNKWGFLGFFLLFYLFFIFYCFSVRADTVISRNGVNKILCSLKTDR